MSVIQKFFNQGVHKFFQMHILLNGVSQNIQNTTACVTLFEYMSTNQINTINLTNGTVSNNAYDGAWVTNASSGFPWAVCISQNGQYRLILRTKRLIWLLL